eukprot:5693698-Alexandrium_andersonii.AAC.1
MEVGRAGGLIWHAAGAPQPLPFTNTRASVATSDPSGPRSRSIDRLRRSVGLESSQAVTREEAMTAMGFVAYTD